MLTCKFELCSNTFEEQNFIKKYCSKKCALADLRCTRKRAVIEKYGGRCVCCGEMILDFLTIDHVNNDGAKERKANYSQQRLGSNKTIGTSDLYSKYLKEPIRMDLQVLCANCNTAKQNRKNFGGKCPHIYTTKQ